jgi:ABC-type nickel/cobalt efflux system permease component RcnA
MGVTLDVYTMLFMDAQVQSFHQELLDAINQMPKNGDSKLTLVLFSSIVMEELVDSD